MPVEDNRNRRHHLRDDGIHKEALTIGWNDVLLPAGRLYRTSDMRREERRRFAWFNAEFSPGVYTWRDETRQTIQRLWKYLKGTAARKPINGKVSAIERKNDIEIFPFGEMNQGGIRELRLKPSIPSHECSNPRHCSLFEWKQFQQTRIETEQQFLSRGRILLKQPRCFD